MTNYYLHDINLLRSSPQCSRLYFTLEVMTLKRLSVLKSFNSFIKWTDYLVVTGQSVVLWINVTAHVYIIKVS
jgi:hypothetical protein